MSDLDTLADEFATDAQRLADRIRPLLAGQDPGVQGAALAQLLSLWLAGHYQMGEQRMEKILAMHIRIVRNLLPGDVKFIKSRVEQ